ncbi:MAG: hypothetical protein FJ298_13260 [Planctomycetes bacterium]|nr:hypothetical protein [Planctomycetota bacterium]
MRSARLLLVLGLLFGATLGLRLTGLGFGVPAWEEPDPDIPGHVDLVREGWTVAAVEEPDEQYPHLIADLARWLPARPPAAGPGAPRDLEGQLAAAAHTHVQVRTLVALVAALAAPLTFLLARRFVRAGWAAFAAALVATSLLHQSFSQQARPHAFASTLMLAAVLAQLRLLSDGSWRAYAFSAAATSLAIGSLHYGIAVVLSALVAHGLRGGGARFLDRRLLLAAAVSLAAIGLFYPFLFEPVGQAREIDGGAVRLAEHAVGLSQFYGRGFAVLAQSLWNYEPLLCALVLLAVLALVVLRERVEARALAVVLGFALPYLVAIGLFERTYERFVLPLLPFLAVFAAWGAQRLAARLGEKVVALACGFALVLPASACVKLAWLRCRPDTLGDAARWLAARGDDETMYVSAAPPALDLPLVRKPEGLLFYGKRPKLPLSPWTAWQARMETGALDVPTYDLRWLVAPRGEAAADLPTYIETLAPALFLIEVYEQRTNHPLQVRLREALRAKGERLARFSPDRDPEASELELFYQLSDHFNDDEFVTWPHFTLRLLRARALGPVLEVWRVPREGG